MDAETKRIKLHCPPVFKLWITLNTQNQLLAKYESAYKEFDSGFFDPYLESQPRISLITEEINAQ